MNLIFEIIPLLKQILTGVGLIGIAVLLYGAYRRDKRIMIRGVYVVVLAIVLWVCGNHIYDTMMDRLPDKLNERYQLY